LISALRVLQMEEKMNGSWFQGGMDKGRIAVMKNDRIVGLITRNGVARYVQIKGN
jgi:hypothetical protein